MKLYILYKYIIKKNNVIARNYILNNNSNKYTIKISIYFIKFEFGACVSLLDVFSQNLIS